LYFNIWIFCVGDALDIDLSSGKITKIISESNLWALEIDVDAALNQFKEMSKDFNSESIAKNLGVPKDILDSLGLDDLTSLFTNPPPGIDEIVALIQILQYADEKTSQGDSRFQRIVIDTAPTGHTLRLLQLPTFLGTLTGKLLKLRAKLSSAVNSFKSFFGASAGPSEAGQGGALEKLEKIQKNLARLRATLRDPLQTQFVVVSIPTALALYESKRLVEGLHAGDVRISALVCNQVVSDSAGPQYCATRVAAQRIVVDRFKRALTGQQPPVTVREVPYVDTEVTGLYGLRFFAQLAHQPTLGDAGVEDTRRLTIFGGKGGVGKTTTAASWAVRMCESGFRTLVVSTDPAHSLGDALTAQLSGIPRRLDAGWLETQGGELWAMEIDPHSALSEFQEIVKQETNGVPNNNQNDDIRNTISGSMGIPDLRTELIDLLGGLEDPPPGADEVVALTKIMSYLSRGYTLPDGRIIRFDRVVLDTAPTGHTLRMLQLPPFLLQLVDRLKKVKEKMSGGILGALTGMSEDQEIEHSQGQSPKTDRLTIFRENLVELQRLLHDRDSCEFTVVTIPTDLASRESARLLWALSQEGIAVRRVIMNQMLPTQNTDEGAEASTNAYLNRLRSNQSKSLSDLRQLCDKEKIPLLEVPYFDIEVRTVYGLRVISNIILPKHSVSP
jgi:arsenite-transporting ATPase